MTTHPMTIAGPQGQIRSRLLRLIAGEPEPLLESEMLDHLGDTRIEAVQIGVAQLAKVGWITVQEIRPGLMGWVVTTAGAQVLDDCANHRALKADEEVTDV